MNTTLLQTAVGLPAPACRLLCALALADALGERPSRESLSKQLGVTVETVSKTMTDLVRAGAVERVISGGYRQGSSYTWKLNNSEVSTARRRPDGKIARCERCDVVNPRGRFCEKCKQKRRVDRAWRDEAVAVARRHLEGGGSLSVYRVQADLVRNGNISVPLWDRPNGANEISMPGLVSVLLGAGLLGDEWRVRQERALGRRDDDE